MSSSSAKLVSSCIQISFFFIGQDLLVLYSEVPVSWSCIQKSPYSQISSSGTVSSSAPKQSHTPTTALSEQSAFLEHTPPPLEQDHDIAIGATTTARGDNNNISGADAGAGTAGAAASHEESYLDFHTAVEGTDGGQAFSQLTEERETNDPDSSTTNCGDWTPWTACGAQNSQKNARDSVTTGNIIMYYHTRGRIGHVTSCTTTLVEGQGM